VRRSAIFVAVFAMVTAGCTGEEPVRGPTPAVPTIAAAHLPQGWRRCVNEAEGWSIGYPGTWFTTDLYTDALTGETERHPRIACAYIDPRRFTLPHDGDPSGKALGAGVGSVPMETTVGYLTDPLFYRTLMRDAWVVLGMPAVRLEVEALGMPLPLKGTLRYGWIVDLGDGRSFWVLAEAAPRTSRDRYLAYRRVASRAIATVELPPAVSPT
jgi:hypothetical protein